jgi:hypothetical protein
MIRKPKPLCLPSNYIVLNGYLETHKKELFSHIIDSLEYASEKNLKDITVFTFDQSKYTISISSEDFKENVDFLYKMFLDNEQYELCSKINNLKEQYASKELS